jgi:hypothetical protein
MPLLISAGCGLLTCFSPLLSTGDLGEPPQMPLLLAELSSQERLDQVPGHRWPDGSTAQADDVDVIVFDALLRREVVGN